MWAHRITWSCTVTIALALSLDLSLSMMAEDERPSRLERMKQEVRRLRASSPGDRFALIGFAGRSYILAPLTADGGAIDLFLDNLSPSIVGQAGSALAPAAATLAAPAPGQPPARRTRPRAARGPGAPLPGVIGAALVLCSVFRKTGCTHTHTHTSDHNKSKHHL